MLSFHSDETVLPSTFFSARCYLIDGLYSINLYNKNNNISFLPPFVHLALLLREKLALNYTITQHLQQGLHLGEDPVIGTNNGNIRAEIAFDATIS